MYETLRFEEGEDRTKWSVVSGKLDNACARRTSKHVHVTRDTFLQLQQGSKSVDQFVVELRKQVRDCAFGELQDDLILHVLIRGVSNERMRRRLLETENLDLPKTIRNVSDDGSHGCRPAVLSREDRNSGESSSYRVPIYQRGKRPV